MGLVTSHHRAMFWTFRLGLAVLLLLVFHFLNVHQHPPLH
jgi:hypothetical protein